MKVIIGVSGYSGSGKTTFTKLLAKRLRLVLFRKMISMLAKKTMVAPRFIYDQL